MQQYENMVIKIMDNLDDAVDYQHDLKQGLHNQARGSPGRLVAWEKAHKQYQRYLHQMSAKVMAAARRQQRDELQHQAAQTKAYQFLKDTHVKPLHALYTKDGHLCTDPSLVDELMRHHWHNTFMDSAKSHLQAVANFIIKYCCMLFFAAPFHVDPLTGQDLMSTCTNATASSQGLDHWTVCEFRLLPMVVFNHLAHLLNAI